MRKTLQILLITFLVLLNVNGICLAGLKDHPYVAVFDVANNSIIDDINVDDIKIVTNYMIKTLKDSGRFNVMKRSQLRSLAQDYNLNLTEKINIADAPQIGNMLGVEFIVISSLTGITTKHNVGIPDPSKYPSLRLPRSQVVANIAVRIMDVKTGRIVLAALGRGCSANPSSEIVLNAYQHDRQQTTMTGSRERIEDVEDDNSITTAEHKVKISTEIFSSVQVHNALYKAVVDVVKGKYGCISKLDNGI